MKDEKGREMTYWGGEMKAEDELRSARKEIAFVEYVALPDALAAIARARQEERENYQADAARFQKLQSMEPVYAQAYFWNYQSKKQRAKAIDDGVINAPRAEGENNG